MELGGSRMCFACGEDNPVSLGLDFKLVGEDRVQTEFVPQEIHQGYDGIMHGGLISTLLDEAMVKILEKKEIKTVTAEMKTRFKKPIRIGEELIITGILKKKYRNLMFTEGYVKNNKGEVLAHSEAKFMQVK